MIIEIDTESTVVLDANDVDAFRVEVSFKVRNELNEPIDIGKARAWVGGKPGAREGSPCGAWHEEGDFADLTPEDAHAEARELFLAAAFALYKRALRMPASQ